VWCVQQQAEQVGHEGEAQAAGGREGQAVGACRAGWWAQQPAGWWVQQQAGQAGHEGEAQAAGGGVMYLPEACSVCQSSAFTAADS